MSDTLHALPKNLLEQPEIPDSVKELLGVLPGLTQSEATLPTTAHRGGRTTEPYCPPWATFADPAAPGETFTENGRTFNVPLVHEEPNPMLYPMCTVGIVFNSNGRRGSGVLVGPNLLLTAGHVAPWGAANWSMEFVPAYNSGARPFGSSYVQSYHGFNPNGSVTGYDYVICKLYNPLGNALGWMGSASFGSEDDYYNKRFVSSGYPGSYGERPAVELDMAVRDIDNDSPGKELEFDLRADLGHGWSGGPLWDHTANPYVVGVLSGTEKDFLDPTRLVYASGGGLVDLVRYGQATWPV